MSMSSATADVSDPLLPPAAKDVFILPDDDPRFVGEQVRMLFSNSLVAIVTTAVIAIVIYGFLASASMPMIEVWLAWSLLVSLWRGGVVWQYRRTSGAEPDPASWRNKFQRGAFAAGATLGLLGVFFFPAAPPTIKIFIVMVLVGSGAGAVGVFGASTRVYAAYVLPTMLPLIIAMFMQDERTYHVIAGMGILYVLVCLLFARNISGALRGAIQIKFAHEATLALLRDEVRMREQMSAELVERETHMRTLVDNVPAYIAHYNGDEILTYTNKAYTSLFGKVPDDIVGRSAREILGAAPYDAQADEARRALAGESQHYQKRLSGPDGAPLLLDISRAPYRDANGVLDGYYLFAVDRTEETRLTDALRSSETQGQMLLRSLELTGEAIFSKALDGTITSWNRGAELTYGYTADEAIGRHQRELYMSNVSDEDYAVVQQRILSGQPSAFEAKRQRKDGRELHVLISTSPIFEQDGTLIGETTVARDITEMRLGQLALEKAERELRVLIDHTPAMICYIDRDFHFRMVNKAYAVHYGKSATELIGHNFRDVFSTAQLTQVEHYFQLALQGKPVRYERISKDAGGVAHDLVVRYVPNFDGMGNVIGVFVLLTDVSDLKKLDRMKSEFVSTVSHELRTPLTSIRGSLGLLAGGIAGNLPDEARDLIGIAQKNCERLINLINDILDIEKIESGDLTVELVQVDLMKLVEDAVKQNIGYAAEREVALIIVERVAAAPVAVDAARIAQVMANLLSNAAKYTTARGTVEVGVTPHGAGFRVRVKDCGPGISPAFRARIFQRFSQNDSSDTRRVGGTGLGLAISKSIIERCGGSIGFESTPGEGATFFFDLPAVAATVDSANHGAKPRTQSQTRRVLVCEDDADVADLIQRILGQQGIKCVIAKSAAEAKAQLAEGRFDAMTLDLGLPDQGGLALLADIRQIPALRRLPVVVVTASSDKPAGHTIGALEITDWLVKPIDNQRLLQSIGSVASSGAMPVVLHIEDDADIRRVVQAMVGATVKYEAATTLAKAAECLARNRYDLVILEVTLGDGDGTSLLPQIEAIKPAPPVLLFSALEASSEIAKRVNAALRKSDASDTELLNTVRRLIG